MIFLLLFDLEEIRNGEERLEELGFSWFPCANRKIERDKGEINERDICVFILFLSSFGS